MTSKKMTAKRKTAYLFLRWLHLWMLLLDSAIGVVTLGFVNSFMFSSLTARASLRMFYGDLSPRER